MFPTLFRNIPDVVYGVSTYQVPIVVSEPFAFSPTRNFINLTIAILMIVFVYSIWSTYLRVKKPILLSLAFLTTLSIVASGVHHIDNFLRLDLYFLASWIYNGLFFILDVGLANWVIASALAYYSMSILLTEDSSRPSERTTFAFRLMYIHCVMIWSGQAHYMIEPFSNFTTVANISILAEGWSAIALNLYALYFQFYVLLSEESTYSPVSTSEAEDDLELTSNSSSVIQEKENDTTKTVRRRSKDRL